QRTVPVVGSTLSESAPEEALSLTLCASKIYRIHRRDKLHASNIMADRVLAHKKIEPVWNTVVTRYIPHGKGEMRAIDLRNVLTHEERELPVVCVFIAIGHNPNAKPYSGKLEMDSDGYLITKQ